MSAADRPVGEAPSLVRWACAKVNLYLRVVGRRADGHHELDSLVVFAGVADRLSFAARAGLALEVGGPLAADTPGGEDNLVIRAARALADVTEVRAAARITLDKHLPVAAGLGGGSADAAAALRGLAALWSVAPRGEALRALALALGADVPVCLYGRPAFIGGIGERIDRAPPLPATWMVLVNPGVALSTARVFAARAGAFSEPGRWSTPPAGVHDLADELAGLGNDLEAPARGLAPEVDEVLSRLARAPEVLLARMSGSGATCFGLCAPDEAGEGARAAAAAIRAEHPEWWVTAAPVLHGPVAQQAA